MAQEITPFWCLNPLTSLAITDNLDRFLSQQTIIDVLHHATGNVIVDSVIGGRRIAKLLSKLPSTTYHATGQARGGCPRPIHSKRL